MHAASFSDNPVADSFRAYERGCAEAAERAARINALKDTLLAEARGDLSAFSAIGPCRHRVWEVLFAALDYREFTQEAVALLCRAASGAPVQADAADLLERIAENFADMEAA